MIERYLEEYPPVLDIPTVAKILGVTNKTIRQMVRDNKLFAIRVGNRIRIPKDRFIEFLETQAN